MITGLTVESNSEDAKQRFLAGLRSFVVTEPLTIIVVISTCVETLFGEGGRFAHLHVTKSEAVVVIFLPPRKDVHFEGQVLSEVDQALVKPGRVIFGTYNDFKNLELEPPLGLRHLLRLRGSEGGGRSRFLPSFHTLFVVGVLSVGIYFVLQSNIKQDLLDVRNALSVLKEEMFSIRATLSRQQDVIRELTLFRQDTNVELLLFRKELEQCLKTLPKTNK
jgi:hypothetical protein